MSNQTCACQVEDDVGEHEGRVPPVVFADALIHGKPVLDVDVIIATKCAWVMRLCHDDGRRWCCRLVLVSVEFGSTLTITAEFQGAGKEYDPAKWVREEWLVGSGLVDLG